MYLSSSSRARALRNGLSLDLFQLDHPSAAILTCSILEGPIKKTAGPQASETSSGGEPGLPGWRDVLFEEGVVHALKFGRFMCMVPHGPEVLRWNWLQVLAALGLDSMMVLPKRLQHNMNCSLLHSALWKGHIWWNTSGLRPEFSCTYINYSIDLHIDFPVFNAHWHLLDWIHREMCQHKMALSIQRMKTDKSQWNPLKAFRNPQSSLVKIFLSDSPRQCQKNALRVGSLSMLCPAMTHVSWGQQCKTNPPSVNMADGVAKDTWSSLCSHERHQEFRLRSGCQAELLTTYFGVHVLGGGSAPHPAPVSMPERPNSV